MQKLDRPVVGPSERHELEFVISRLERTPKLANLLRYLAEKYLSGESEELNEYNIATEVFGRQPDTFTASEDSVARVQMHRLRKCLKEIYERDGKDHSVRVSIPLGAYTPTFTYPHSDEGSLDRFGLTRPGSSLGLNDAESDHPEPFDRLSIREPKIEEEADESIDTASAHTQSGRAGFDEPTHDGRVPSSSSPGDTTWPRWIALGALVVLIAVLIASWRRHRTLESSSGANTLSIPQATAGSLAVVSGAGTPLPLNLIGGYDGPPERDSSGEVWQADRFFTNGWKRTSPTAYIARTSDQFIFRQGRAGDCDYDIPLAAGIYELHLYFMEPSEALQSEDAENKSVFNVTINGQIRLLNFDIVSDAMGRNIGDERVTRDLSPAPDGKLHIHISTVIGTPSLSALRLVRGIPHRQIPIRIVTQPTSYTDARGTVWGPDNYYMGGRYLSHDTPPADAGSFEWLSSERYGHFSYAFPVDPRDRYTLILHFKEQYFGSTSSPSGGVGSRVFRVLCNGNTLLDDFDIFKEGGSNKVVDRSFYHLKPTAQGKLNVTFEPIVNYATVSAIEVIDEN